MTFIKSSTNSDSNYSSGPKTPAGKKRASRNALREGYFSKELILKPEEQSEFDTVRAALQAQLKPATAMQWVAFDRVVACYPRVGRALRRETRRVELDLNVPSQQDGPSEGVAQTAESRSWYGEGPGELQAATRLLSNLRREIESNNFNNPEHWKGPLTKTFGPEFYEVFSSWSPREWQAAMLARHLTSLAKNLNLPLSEAMQPATGAPEVSDANLQREMMLKIIDLKQQLVNDVRRLLDQQSAGDSQRVASSEEGRYFASACRDLERAVTWYRELVEKGL